MHSFGTFRFRLFITYLIVSLFFTLVIGIPLYLYLKRNIEANISASIEQKALSTSDKFDYFYQIYSSITTQIYMDTSGDTSGSGKSVVQLLDPITTDEDDRHRLDQNNIIFNKLILLTELHKEVSRISVFNLQGDMFSNRDYDTDSTLGRVYSPEELQEIRNRQGVAFFQYKEKDNWSADSREPVFRFVRQLRIADREIGFMEIQFPAKDLLQFADQGDDAAAQASLYLFTPASVLYPNDFKPEDVHLKEQIALLSNDSNQPSRIKSLAIEDKYAVVVSSDQPSYTVAYVIPENELFDSLYWFRNISIGTVILLALFSIVVFYLLSKRLTYPLIQLRKAINSVAFGEKAPDIENEIQANEIEMLNRAFRNMNDRLQQSMEESVHFRTIQLQSHFNTLQAQINPHFLFNMLGVIKALSDRDGNETVSSVTGKLAQFLQYPLDSRSVFVQLSDEFQFVRDYLHLMKVRYMQRLDYKIEIEEQAETLQIPKLIIQPLAENCIKHGFTATNSSLRIRIQAVVSGKQWKLSVSDNGPGFSLEKLRQLNEQIVLIDDTIHQNRQFDPLSIGGMGLISTFVRMKLLYKHHVDITVGNLPDGGAVIEMNGYFIEM